MPAVLGDPTSPTIYRRSGPAPFPDPNHPSIPDDIVPRQVTLRDLQTTATIVPFATRHQVPPTLIAYLCDQFNREIEGGDAYPMMDLFTDDSFARYWFQNFGAVMLLGDIDGPESVVEGKDWSRECLGSFNIRPNYPGRSSHVCNAMFLVTNASRGRGVGRLMGEAYIDWAPRLGYTYSVFNLVYETNVASCRIWDALGFKRIGRVKGCGNLKSYPDRLIDALIYGRDLSPGGEGEELVSEERFDKIKYYLKYNKYPNGADRAEKSRLRSAATHYKLLADDKLMLKDKEVISDPARQYDIARTVHEQLHGGINKTTATIAEKYHWSRIKETVSDVIKNCVECSKENGKPASNTAGARKAVTTGTNNSANTNGIMNGNGSLNPTDTVTNTAPSSLLGGVSLTSGLNGTGAGTVAVGADTLEPNGGGVVMDARTRVLSLQDHAYAMMPTLSQPSSASSPGAYADPSELSSITPAQTLQNAGTVAPGSAVITDQLPPTHTHHHRHHQHPHHHTASQHLGHDEPTHTHTHTHHHLHHGFHPHDDLMTDTHHHQQQQQQQQQHQQHNGLHHQVVHHHDQYQPIDPQIIEHTNFDHYHTHDFQALLSATEDDDASGLVAHHHPHHAHGHGPTHHHHHHHHHPSLHAQPHAHHHPGAGGETDDSVDRDLEMLIDPHGDDDMADALHGHGDGLVLVGKGVDDDHRQGGKGDDDDDDDGRMVYDVGFGTR